MKLNDLQIDVLVTLCEGQIIDDDEGILSLDDADHNTYFIHRNTFNALSRKGMIEFKNEPCIGISRYGLTKKAEEFLFENHYDRIKDFVQ